MTAAGFSRYAVAAVLVGVLAGFAFGGSSRGVAAAEDTLLSGKVVSSTCLLYTSPSPRDS